MISDAATLINIIIVIGAYLSGSIPTGVVLARRFSGIDVRQQGSGNIGATNVGREAGWRLGLLTLFLDMLKGAVPVWVAVRWAPGHPDWVVAAAATAAVLGHLFPLYSRFRGGGKGVATAAGSFLIAAPAAFLAAVLVFVPAVLVSRRMSVGSLAAAVALPVGIRLLSPSLPLFISAGCVSLLLLVRHKDNIRRLLTGTEPILSGRRKQP